MQFIFIYEREKICVFSLSNWKKKDVNNPIELFKKNICI